MHRIQALIYLFELAKVHDDEEGMMHAANLVYTRPESPPAPLVGVGGRVDELAADLHKTASIDSEALRILTFRLAKVVEAYDGLLNQITRPSETHQLPDVVDLLADIWEMVAYDQCTPESVAAYMIDRAKHNQALASAIQMVDERATATTSE